MLLCSNCVVRLSPLLCKYLATCSLSTTLSSKPYLSLGTSLRTSLLNPSQSKIYTGRSNFDNWFQSFSLFFLVFSISHSRSFHTSNKRDKKDYYEVLGIPKTANAKDVKKAYYTVCFFSHLCIKNV